MNFIIVNNEIIQKDKANISYLCLDQPFIISRKIWFGFGGIPLFTENIDSICQQLKVLNFPVPDFLKNRRELFRISKRLLNKNRYYKTGILNLQLYLINSELHYTISCQPFDSSEFPFSKNGALVNISNIHKDSTNPLSRYGFYNKTIWKVVESQLRKTNYQNSILLNEKKMVCEGIATNIFMMKDDVLVTPSLDSGCFEDTIRTSVLEVANRLKMKVLELSKIKKEYLLEMNELFFASEQKGIEWILGIENKRFIHFHTEKIHQELNNCLKERVN
jgi:branched-chain amino acid aminotransferase